MSSAELGRLLRHLRRLAATADPAERTDHQLLADSSAGRDQAAFAALMKRHGRLVLGVSRQVLRHTEDAEDAYQATFLVLARRAASIRDGSALISWLHRVAYRIATDFKRKAQRRRLLERGAQTMSPKHPSREVAWQEVTRARSRKSGSGCCRGSKRDTRARRPGFCAALPSQYPADRR